MTTAVKQHCPYCASESPEDGSRHCPTCGVPHHEDCWKENGGCAVFGCESAPRPESKTTELPAIAEPPAAATHARRRRSRSRGVLIGAGLVLLLVVLAAAGGAAALILRDSEKTEVAPAEATPAAAVADEPSADAGAANEAVASPPPEDMVNYKTYVPSDQGYYYAAQVPQGDGWSPPAESFPTGGALLRTTITGPDGVTLVIDRTPYEIPQLGGTYESMQTVSQPTFGSATEYVFSASENFPECNGQRCVDYLVEDGQGGGWGVLASGPDFEQAREVARKVMESLSLADV